MEIFSLVTQKDCFLPFRDELSSWLGAFNKYSSGSSDRGLYLECWNGGSHTIDRVKKSGQPVEVEYASLAILGGIQPDRLNEIFLGPDDGLASRFIYVWPSPVPFKSLNAIQDRKSDQRKRLLFSALEKLHHLKMEKSADGKKKPKCIPLQSTELFDEIRKESTEKARTTQGFMAGWFGKNPGRILRLALTIEYLGWAISNSDEPGVISDISIASAGTFLDYAEKMCERAICGLGSSQQEKDAFSIAQYILKEKPQQLNERKLYQGSRFFHLRDKCRREKAFAYLERSGWVKPAMVKTGGRPSGDWCVNPKVTGKK